jgi:hypothetical protein
MKNSQVSHSKKDKEKREISKEEKEKLKAKEKAEKRAREEAKHRSEAEEKAWKEAEKLSSKQADKELKEENERRKKREQLVNKLGVQKPGQYIVKVESQDTQVIDSIETRLGKIEGLEIVYSGGSTEGIQFGIRLDQETPMLLNITDLPIVTKADLKNNVVRVKCK